MTENSGLKIRQNVSLAPFTTLKIGGAARFFVSADSENEIVEALEFARKNDLEIFVLGGGSNILISDDGFNGLALQIKLRGISLTPKSAETIFVTAQAGEDWDRVVEFCVNENLAGLECLSGIPGFAGGTPVQNVGAYGQEVSEIIVSVRCFDRRENRIVELTNEDCGFSYRASIFNTGERDRYIVLSVTYALKKNGSPKIVYRELREVFGDAIPTLKETREAVLKIRRAKSMVISAADINARSAGSFFKNPLVSQEKFAEIEAKAEISAFGKVPSFPFNETSVKIPAAWLIEKSGFRKGFRMRGVGISNNHTLAIVNFDNGSARDVLDLKDEIQRRVLEEFGVELTPEPIFVGF